MKRLTSPGPVPVGLGRWRRPARLLGSAAILIWAGIACQRPVEPDQDSRVQPPINAAASVVIASPPGTPRPPFTFTNDDDKLLDEVEHAAFLFLWQRCSPKTGMVVDRSSVTFASIAGVGFQLAALPIGVERGWVSRDEARSRAEQILTALEANPNCRKAGLFYHFLDADRADPTGQDAVSTIDSALFFAGALVAGSYFGGTVRERADRLFADADWSFFVEHSPRPHEPHMKGFLSLGWKPKNPSAPTGNGALLPYYWADSGDEHRLVTFLAAAAPDPSRRVDPKLYYQLRRPLGDFAGAGLHVYVPWSGALFTDFFANCFINYSAMGPDDPAAFGVERRPQVDWWENSRRAVLLHRAKAIAAHDSGACPNLGPLAWGLTACDGPKGYVVPGVYPDAVVPGDYRPDVDYPKFKPKDDLGGGIVAPYAAGCAILFQPDDAIAALRHYRGLRTSTGGSLVWRSPEDSDPAEFGFRDSFDAAAGWVSPDCVSIDQGPLVLALENARTGRVWGWFQAHPFVQAAFGRLGWTATR